MTLSMAPKGMNLKIHKVTGKDDMRNRLATLGFVEGANCSVVNEINGSLIANIKNTRIALDKSLCNRILVKQEKEV